MSSTLFKAEEAVSAGSGARIVSWSSEMMRRMEAKMSSMEGSLALKLAELISRIPLKKDQESHSHECLQVFYAAIRKTGGARTETA